jgi:tRNA threonylcarbamoyladenosine biosynthesis protein TsaE
MDKTITFNSRSEAQTIELGARIGGMLRPGCTVLICGELGAGKTRLAKGIISAATGIDESEIVSPSFTLVNTYEGAFVINHADLYRLASAQIDDIGLAEYVDKDSALLIEWAERIDSEFDDPLQVTIEYGVDEDSRIIHLVFDEQGQWKDLADLMQSERTASGAS